MRRQLTGGSSCRTSPCAAAACSPPLLPARPLYSSGVLVSTRGAASASMHAVRVATRGEAWRSVAKRGEAPWRVSGRGTDYVAGTYGGGWPVGIVLPASCAHPWAGRGMGGTRMWHSSSGGDSAPALLTQSRSVEILHVQPPDKTTTVADGPSCMASADSVTVSRMLTLRKLAARCRSGAP